MTDTTKDTTMTMPLQRPVALELVSAETVDLMLEQTEVEQIELRRRADDLLSTALELEQQLATFGITPEASNHLMMRLHEFLGELTVEAAVEAAALVSTAHRRVALTGASHNWGSALAVSTPVASVPAVAEVARPPLALVPDPVEVPEDLFDLASLEVADAATPDEFWAETDHRPWWRRRDVSAGAALTALGVITALLAVAVQVA
ncbi:MAG TPA: hypothetical protein VGN51_07935 [Acidimicrobiia bacterium]|jgi:hypothetical protein